MTLNTLEEAQEIRRCIKVLQETADFIDKNDIEIITFTANAFGDNSHRLALDQLNDGIIQKRLMNNFLGVIINEMKQLNEKFAEL